MGRTVTSAERNSLSQKRGLPYWRTITIGASAYCGFGGHGEQQREDCRHTKLGGELMQMTTVASKLDWGGVARTCRCVHFRWSWSYRCYHRRGCIDPSHDIAGVRMFEVMCTSLFFWPHIPWEVPTDASCRTRSDECWKQQREQTSRYLRTSAVAVVVAIVMIS